MTLYHLVLFQLKSEFNATTFNKVSTGFNNMKQHIPLIQKSSFGKNLTERGKGYTHALVVELKSMEDLKEYIQHPHHVELATAFKECCEVDKTLAIDYEV
ncbi:hypothetical protein K502DRAFT_325548 [Neoconidiobolus thromboides FSU 785]|nr:hypothetical protein K502DRAFT_325548 [Neoconidiobolus thromboides FSU 785]